MCKYIYFFFIYIYIYIYICFSERLPWWLRRQSVCLQCGRPGLDPWVGKFPGEGKGNPLQYSCLENPMDKRAWCPWGRKESDTTEQLHFHFHFSLTGC